MNSVLKTALAVSVTAAGLFAGPLLAQPAGTAKPATLGGKAAKPGSKLMTRDELRMCLSRSAVLSQGAPVIEAQRVTLDRERAELTQSAEALKADRAEIDRRLATVREWEVRMKAHAQEVEAWNKRAADYKDAGRKATQVQGKELDADRDRLQMTLALLAAEEKLLVPAYEESVKQFNTRAAQRDQRVEDWNQRNARAADASQRHNDDRNDWLKECADRPYREDDEKAIKAGK